MSDAPALLPTLIRQTLTDPRAAAHRIIGFQLPSHVLWQGMALVVALSVIAAQLTAFLLAPSATDTTAGQEMLMPTFFSSPFLMGFIQGAILVMMVFAVHWIGRAMGGTGQFPDAIALVVWLQFLLVCLQVVQALLGMVAPGFSGLVGLLGIGLFFYLLSQFVLVLHGFQSAALVFVMILVSLLGLTFVLSVVLTLLGIVVVGEAPSV
jgi:hypothetical protein